MRTSRLVPFERFFANPELEQVRVHPACTEQVPARHRWHHQDGGSAHEAKVLAKPCLTKIGTLHRAYIPTDPATSGQGRHRGSQGRARRTARRLAGQ
jgi:hypothetical protein